MTATATGASTGTVSTHLFDANPFDANPFDYVVPIDPMDELHCESCQ